MNAQPLPPTLATADRASWSVVVAAVGDDAPLLDVHAGTVLKTASIAKLLLLVEVAAQIEDGRLEQHELLNRRSVAPVADSGLWHRLATDELPVGDIAALVAAVSDNWGTNVLIERVGLAAVQERAVSLGIHDSSLFDYVRDERTAAHPETLSAGTARDWAGFMARLSLGTVVSPAVSRRVLEWMIASCDHSLVASAFGLDPLSHWTPDRGLTLRNKTGTDTGVRADVGLLRSTGDIAYAAIVNWDEAAHPDLRPAVLADLRAIGDWVLERAGGR